MAEVKVRTGEIEVRTAKLTKSLLKQIPVITYATAKEIIRPDGNEKPELVIGWVHGSVLGDDYKQWLIVKTGEGSYGRLDAMHHTCNKYPQIFVV